MWSQHHSSSRSSSSRGKRTGGQGGVSEWLCGRSFGATPTGLNLGASLGIGQQQSKPLMLRRLRLLLVVPPVVWLLPSLAAHWVGHQSSPRLQPSGGWVVEWVGWVLLSWQVCWGQMMRQMLSCRQPFNSAWQMLQGQGLQGQGLQGQELQGQRQLGGWLYLRLWQRLSL